MLDWFGNVTVTQTSEIAKAT